MEKAIDDWIINAVKTVNIMTTQEQKWFKECLKQRKILDKNVFLENKEIFKWY